MAEKLKELPQLIDLQAAHVTQLTNKGKKSDWRVRKNITGEDLGKFPPSIDDPLMFKILDFARKFELIAFNAGITFQKNKQNVYLLNKIKELELLTEQLTTHNDYLAGALETVTKNEVN